MANHVRCIPRAYLASPQPRENSQGGPLRTEGTRRSRSCSPKGVLRLSAYTGSANQLFDVLGGGGFRFHRPSASQEPEQVTAVLSGIEAKPREAAEPRLKDARYTVERYVEREGLGVREELVLAYGNTA